MRRRASLIALAAVLALAALPVSVPPAAAAHRSAAPNEPTVEVYGASGGIVRSGADLVITVVIDNQTAQLVDDGNVTVSVTSHPIATPAALTGFEADPGQTAQRSLGRSPSSEMPAGSTDVAATVTVPAASVKLPSSNPGVFGLTATVTTGDGTHVTGTGTLVVPGSSPTTVGVAAVMPITVPPSGSGLIAAQDLATYTGADGVLTRELTIAESNPELTLGIDPMILASIRVLGSSAPASAQAWIASLAQLTNPTFPLQYGDADPGLQTQAGLAKPLAPTDFSYAMSPSDFGTALSVGEPTVTPTDTPTPTPTPSPTNTHGPQLPPLSELTGWTYSLGGIAWPAPASVRAADLTAFSRAGLPTTIVSSSNTNAASLPGTPDAAMPVDGGTALVTDDDLSQALQAAATASDGFSADAANATLNAQLALAAQNAQNGGILLASLGRSWPTDASRASAAVAAVFDSDFSRAATLQNALAAPPTSGLSLTDKRNPDNRVERAADLLDLAGEPRSGGTPASDNIAAFSSVLQTPALLSGDVRARLLDLFSVGWAGSADWDTAVTKQLTSMDDTLSGVQIVSPGSIRQASHQALIPITVTNKLSYAVAVVLRATPSPARIEVDPNTTKTIAAGSSAKVLVPVKAQLSNGTVFLDLQLYSQTGVRIGVAQSAEIDVHADWEGIGAMIFGIVVVGFLGFGLFRTIQRRRRERAEAATTGAEAPPVGEDARG